MTCRDQWVLWLLLFWRAWLAPPCPYPFPLLKDDLYKRGLDVSEQYLVYKLSSTVDFSASQINVIFNACVETASTCLSPFLRSRSTVYAVYAAWWRNARVLSCPAVYFSVAVYYDLVSLQIYMTSSRDMGLPTPPCNLFFRPRSTTHNGYKAGNAPKESSIFILGSFFLWKLRPLLVGSRFSEFLFFIYY